MTAEDPSTTVGALPDETNATPLTPVVLTRLVWVLWLASLGVLLTHVQTGGSWELSGLLVVDGLTVSMWVVVTFFGGIVHSYSRRYMAGHRRVERFFAGVFAFTLVVMTLVAADHVALFVIAWLAMGLVMAALIGHVEGWPQARAAAALARRYFLASGAVLALGLGVLSWSTGATTVSGVVAAADAVPTGVWLVGAGALLLAAMIQSALVPFHTWLLASMTAPTPASALMHAGFVNAGGVLLLRVAPVVTVHGEFMLLIVVVGAVSALLGKLLKSVQTDVKRTLGCSTVGQMGFMIMQAGLGFFGAALAHLVLHGFYKAHRFLSSGSQVEQTAPKSGSETNALGVAGVAVTLTTALVGGWIFTLLTGKGAKADAGLLLTGLVVLTTMHAARTTAARTTPSAAVRFVAIPLVFLPAIALYAAVYRVVGRVLTGVPVVTAPAELTVVHGLVAVAFLGAYLAIETGLYRHSTRLYVALLNATRPPSTTLLTDREEYDAY
jgi:NAD(P)H-quinone oxidoreductase subunit 5